MLVEKIILFQCCFYLLPLFIHVLFRISVEPGPHPLIQAEKDSILPSSRLSTYNLDFFRQTQPSVQACGF